MKYQVKVPLTKTNLLERIDEAEVFRRYIDRDPADKGLSTNPLRKDKSPGCSFYISSSGRLMYKDWSKGETYDIFKVVMVKYNLSFYRALEKINEDFKIGLGTANPIPPIDKVETFTYDNGTQIQIIPKEYTQKELGYWKINGIFRDSLKKGSVYSVDKVYMNKQLKMRSTEKNPIFGYVFPDNTIKLYRPFGKKSQKWRGNSSYIFGWNRLPLFPVDEVVIITKSFKDAMYLDQLGYYAVAPPTEVYIWKKADIDTLKELFSDVIVFYDNDGEFNPPKGESGKGKEATKKLCKKFDLKYIMSPDGKPKDITDIHKRYNENIARRWLQLALKFPRKI